MMNFRRFDVSTIEGFLFCGNEKIAIEGFSK